MEIKIIDSFIKKNFKTETNILIFGSYINDPKQNSDIDILIVSDKASSFIKEIFIYKNRQFDVMIIPTKDMHLCLQKDRFLKVYLDIFIKGIIYLEENSFLTKMINTIKSSKISSDIFLRRKFLDHKISKYYFQLFESKSVYEAEFILNELTKSILTKRLLDYGISNVVDIKYLLKHMVVHDKQLVEYLFKIQEKLF